MTRALIYAAMVVALVTTRPPSAAQLPAASLTADALVAQVVNVRRPTGFRIWATVTRSTSGETAKVVRQLVITGRRDPKRKTTLYRQMWPEVSGGRALVIDDIGDHRLNGFLYQSGRVTQLSSTMLGEPFFDSDLTLEDVAQPFWQWPSRTIAGREAVGAHDCVIVELRPAPQMPTSYSLIRTWLAPDVSVGLRMEQFGRDGRPVKRIGLYQLLKLSDRWVASVVTVEPTDGRSRTVIEGTKYEPDVKVSAADFTVAAIRRSLRKLG